MYPIVCYSWCGQIVLLIFAKYFPFFMSDNNLISFDNTEYAFAYKKSNELKKANFLFSDLPAMAGKSGFKNYAAGH